MTSGFDVFCGLDVGKGEHHATGLSADGTRVRDAALPNTEVGLRDVFDRLARHGRILIVVDQPASIGALPVAVARACGHEVAHLPGLAPVPPPFRQLHSRRAPPEGSHEHLKRAFFLAAFAALADPVSRAYYDPERAEGKRHDAALPCLARRRCDILFATPRDKTYYQPPAPQPA